MCIKHVYMKATDAHRVHVNNGNSLGRRIAVIRQTGMVLRVPVESQAVNHEESNGGLPSCELRACLFRYKVFILAQSKKQTLEKELGGSRQVRR